MCRKSLVSVCWGLTSIWFVRCRSMMEALAMSAKRFSRGRLCLLLDRMSMSDMTCRPMARLTSLALSLCLTILASGPARAAAPGTLPVNRPSVHFGDYGVRPTSLPGKAKPIPYTDGNDIGWEATREGSAHLGEMSVGSYGFSGSGLNFGPKSRAYVTQTFQVMDPYAGTAYIPAWGSVSASDFKVDALASGNQRFAPKFAVSTFRPIDTGGYGIRYTLDFADLPQDAGAVTQLSVNAIRELTATFPTAGTDFTLVYKQPSVSVVAYDGSAAQLDALEAVADQVAAGNAILQEAYGQIIPLLIQIQETTGNIDQTLSWFKLYIDRITELCVSMDKSGKDILSLLQINIPLLISTIQLESDDIQAAIDTAVDKLIAYLDAGFGSKAPDIGSATEDFNSVAGGLDKFESGSITDMTGAVGDLHLPDFNFSGQVLGGLALCGSVVTLIWDALGEYTLVFTFPLIFGIAAVLIGRLARTDFGDDGDDGGRKKHD